MADTVAEWVISDELRQRLGCGAAAALVLPVWFLLLLFVVDNGAALLAAGAMFVISVTVAGLAVRRNRRLPRVVRLDDDGTLVTMATAGPRRRSLDELDRVDLGTSLGVWPLRLTFTDGDVWRLPRELDDLEGFLTELRRRRPGLEVTDHNPPEPDVAGEGS